MSAVRSFEDLANRHQKGLRPQSAPRPVPADAVDAHPLRKGRPSTRRGLLVAAAAATLVMLVAVAIGVIAIDSNDLAPGDARVLQLTIDEDSCGYEGPSGLAAGEAEVVYKNLSVEARWANISGSMRIGRSRTCFARSPMIHWRGHRRGAVPFGLTLPCRPAVRRSLAS